MLLTIMKINSLLNYCCVFLHERMILDPTEQRDNDQVTELFVRNVERTRFFKKIEKKSIFLVPSPPPE